MTTQKFDDELVLTLRAPIQLGTLEFSDLTLREPTGDALCLAEREDPMGELFVKISRTAGVPPAAAKRMVQRDLQRAAGFFSRIEAATVADDEVFDDQLVMTLVDVIEVDKKKLTELTLKEPTGEVLQIADREKGMWAQTCALIAGVTGTPIGAVKKMRQRDLQRARNFFVHFSAEPPSTPSATTSLS